MDETGIVEAWDKIRARIAEAGLTVFPAFPPDGGDLEWPDEDWSGFLDTAVAAGARLLYAETTMVGPERIAEIEELVPDPTPELAAALVAARAHAGRVAGIDLAFTYGVLVHSWMAEVAWLAEIEDAPIRMDLGRLDVPGRELADPDEVEGGEREEWWVARRRAEQARAAEAERLAPIVAEWAPRIAEHPEYLAARNQSARRAVAATVFPDLDSWRRPAAPLDREQPEAMARRHAAWELLRAAEEAQEQVKAARIAAV